MELEKIETTELEVIATNCNVDIVKAEETTLGLKPTIDERALLIEEFETVSKLELILENLQTFKDLRLKFVKNRTQGIDKWHKTAKEIPLRMSQLIDAVKKNQIQINETYEDFLQKAEKHFEVLEQKRIEALQIERANKVKDFLDPENVAEISNELGVMPDSIWNVFIEGLETQYNNRIAAEKKAEKERLETERIEKLSNVRYMELIKYADFFSGEEKKLILGSDLGSISDADYVSLSSKLKISKSEYDKEQERIRKENERLEKEAEKKRKEDLARVERNKKREAELKPYMVFIRCYANLLDANESGYQKEFKEIKIGAELQCESDRKEAKEKALQFEKDQKEKEELRIKLKEKEESDRIEKQRLLDIEQVKLKALKDAALAPDKDKLIALSNRIINIELPQLKSKESIKILDEVTQLLFKVDTYIKEKVESL